MPDQTPKTVTVTPGRLAETLRVGGIAYHREHDKEWRDNPWKDGISVDLDGHALAYLVDYVVTHAEHDCGEHDEDAGAGPAPSERYTATERATAAHRIEADRFVCDGDAESKCHWWPDCDDESFPCEHDYVSHGDACWILDWLNATVPVDNDLDEGSRRDEDGHYPDGPIAWQWEDEYILWTYAPEPTVLAEDATEGDRA